MTTHYYLYSMVTDFFGIFFTLTWVFYSSDVIVGDYLGYFNIFGYIWIWKVGLSIGIPVAIGLLAFFFWGFWYLLYEELNHGCDANFVGFCCLWTIFC